ncbi:hypothetical protein TUE45_04425 [Streptomyces reticuli]|nr:hypothetical protein TUE45_04425 [Streptomyces reticuli]
MAGAVTSADQGVGVPVGRLQGVAVRAGLAVASVLTVCAVLARRSGRTRGPDGPCWPFRSGRTRWSCRTGDGSAGLPCGPGWPGWARGRGQCGGGLSGVSLGSLGPGRAGDRHRHLRPLGEILYCARRVGGGRGAALGLDLRAQDPYVSGQCGDGVTAQVRFGGEGVGTAGLGFDLEPDQNDRAGQHEQDGGQREGAPSLSEGILGRHVGCPPSSTMRWRSRPISAVRVAISPCRAALSARSEASSA